MLNVFICIAALALGLLIQKMQRYYVISFIGNLFAFVLPTLICNSSIMDNIRQMTGFNDITIIAVIIMYSAGTSISFLIFKVLRIRKMEHHISYADEFINEKIQNLLDDIRKEFLDHKKYYGNDLFVSLFFVKRIFWGTMIWKIVRIGHSGMPGILSGPNWNGVIRNYRHTSTGKTVLLQAGNTINFSEINDADFKGLPENILNWSKQNIVYRINILIKKCDTGSKVVFVISINCIDEAFNWSKLEYNERKIQLTYAHNVIDNYKRNLAGHYNFFNCVY
ncbi:MAG TPA: hypothetical protein VEG39_16270 [Clostridia bacterium]|nr:hypothetical protein [Clostridia bacterium]